MITYRHRGVTIAEVWFLAELAPICGPDIVTIRKSLEPISGRRNIASSTLLSDLSPATSLILDRISKESRYEIRRAEAKDNVTYQMLTHPSQEAYRSFVGFYEEFAVQKGLPSLSPVAHIIADSYIVNGNLILTSAQRASKPLVMHSYFAQGDRCRLLYSASHFREAPDAAFRSMIGRVNRWLHWKDMLAFKDLGFRTYDWGGWHSGGDPTLIKISQFKESFGGAPARVYDARYGISLIGSMENAALQMFHQWGNRLDLRKFQKGDAKGNHYQW